MSIVPTIEYNAFTFIDQDEGNQWSIPGPLSGDLVAGLLVALDVLIDEMADTGLTVHHGKRVEITSVVDEITIWISDYEKILEVLENYRRIIQKDVPEYMQMLTMNPRHRPRNWQPKELKVPAAGEFGWWIYDPSVDNYKLYSFRSADFIRGIISMCNAFDVDYRDYIYDHPFRFDPVTRQITKYAIQL